MTIGLLGTKVGMTQVFTNEKDATPVTVIKAGPCAITSLLTTEKNGYTAVQVGYKQIKESKLTKAEKGHLAKTNLPMFRHLVEYRLDDSSTYAVGQVLDVTLFNVGENVTVTATSIGKGFAGNQKRNNFARGPMSHGSKNHRLPGSIGAGTTPGRVYPGKKMAGRLGAKTTTIKNLELIGIDQEQNLLIVKGNVPGKPGNLINIKGN